MRNPGVDASSAREIESIAGNRRGFSPVKLTMDHRIPASRIRPEGPECPGSAAQTTRRRHRYDPIGLYSRSRPKPGRDLELLTNSGEQLTRRNSSRQSRDSGNAALIESLWQPIREILSQEHANQSGHSDWVTSWFSLSNSWRCDTSTNERQRQDDHPLPANHSRCFGDMDRSWPAGAAGRSPGEP